MTMSADSFQNELDFGAAMLLAREMLAAGIINKQEFSKIEKRYAVEYQPIFQYSPAAEENKSRQD